MQKWEQKQKQKAHDYLIENARSNLKRFSNSRQKPTNVNISRTKTLNTTQTSKQQIPINKILQIFQLQHYSNLLNLYKFSQSLLSTDQHQENITEILEHVQQKDRQRFESLLNTLVVMSKNLKMNQKQKQKDKQQKNSKINYSKNSIHPPLPNSISSNKTNKSTSGKLNSSQSKFRIKIKNLNFTPTQKSPPLLKYKQPNTKKTAKKEVPSHPEVLSKIKNQKVRVRQYSTIKAQDDLAIIHNYNIFQNRQCQLQRIQSVSKIIKRLNEKLMSLHTTKKSRKSKPEQGNEPPRQLDIQLEMKEIQQMYLSFDSATLSSNITNIDLQQITQCFAVEISNLIDLEQLKNLAINNEQKIKSLLQESFMIVKQQEREDKSSRVDKDTMKESEEKFVQQIVNFRKMKEPEYIIEPIDNINDLNEQNSFIQHEEVETESLTEIDTQNPQNLQIKLRQNGEDNGMLSSIWGNNYIASVINDFSCFDSLEQSNTNEKPQINDIKNFIDLVMMAGKMEKQIPILANVYLKRLLQLTKRGRLTNRNWRNITLITLIEASKIWDDRSLENHSFSKVIKPYTTLEINRLQKYLLFFIDYRLNINQKQYSQSYFSLRKHSSSSCHTVNLVNLDLKTIKKLQKIEDGSIRDKDEIEKAQFLKKCMNKSF